MSNKRKCSFLITLLITLFCQNGDTQRINYHSQPSEVQANDGSFAYQPFKSENSQSFVDFKKNQPSSNTGSSFPINGQNGFQGNSGFGSFGKDDKNRRVWNDEQRTGNQWSNGNNWSSSQNEPKTDGFGSSSVQQPNKKPGIGDNLNWDAYKQSGNQMDSNSYLNLNPDSKKNQGFTSSSWNSGFQKEDTGNREYQPPPGKKISGDNWNTNSNNWNSGFSSEKKQEITQTGTSSWKPEDSKIFPDRPTQFQTKPGSSNTFTNQWNKVPKPDKINFMKPPKGHENDKNPPQKPSGPTSNSKPGTKVEQIDWASLEKENRKADHRLNCYCVEYDDCDPDRRLDATNIFGSNHFHLRSKIAECSKQGKTCCLTSLSTIPEKSYELAKYEIQGTNLRPSCGKRVSELAPNDKSDSLASYGDFPWILRLVAPNENGEGEKTLCTASLIHSSIALTTASCALLLSRETPRVRAGEWNMGTGHERNKIQEAKIGKIFLHPEFDLVSHTNDMALIILDQAFDSNLGTNSVCLPSPNDAWDSSRCVVSGWFKENRQGKEQPLLAKIDLITVARGKCRNNSEYEINDTGMEDERYICAQARSGDPCIADAGALMCPLYNSDMLVQVGFLSQSGICNEFYRAGTFIDITESIDWITHMEGIYLYFHNKQLQQ